MGELRLRRDGLSWSDLGSEIVILDLHSSSYFSVRGTAAFLVTSLVDGASPDLLVKRLVDTYDTTRDVADADVADFLAALEGRNLLEPADG